MIDPVALLKDLKPQVKALEEDLRARAAEEEFAPALEHEWQTAINSSRTAAPYDEWLEGRVNETAMTWIIGTVFLRFCEDNELIQNVYLSGKGDHRELAKERQQLFFENPENASKTDREWIEEGLKDMVTATPSGARPFRLEPPELAGHHPLTGGRQGFNRLLASKPCVR